MSEQKPCLQWGRRNLRCILFSWGSATFSNLPSNVLNYRTSWKANKWQEDNPRTSQGVRGLHTAGGWRRFPTLNLIWIIEWMMYMEQIHSLDQNINVQSQQNNSHSGTLFSTNQLDNFGQDDLHQKLTHYGVKSPITDNDITEPMEFNLMFETSIGPSGVLPGWEIHARRRESGLSFVQGTEIQFTLSQIQHTGCLLKYIVK